MHETPDKQYRLNNVANLILILQRLPQDALIYPVSINCEMDLSCTEVVTTIELKIFANLLDVISNPVAVIEQNITPNRIEFK